MGVALRVGIATAAWAAAHSLMASRHVKALAGRLVGARRAEAGYRLAYNAGAVASFGLLLAHVAAQPSRTLYRVADPLAFALRLGQAGGALFLAASIREVGLLRMLGVPNLRARLTGAPMPEGPAGQGPERDADGALTTGGPYRWCRHPLNAALLPLFWCTPHLTTRRLAFNAIATAYLIPGSLHEERRLRATYGADYEAYRRRTPFLLPRPPRAEPERGPAAAWRASRTASASSRRSDGAAGASVGIGQPDRDATAAHPGRDGDPDTRACGPPAG